MFIFNNPSTSSWSSNAGTQFWDEFILLCLRLWWSFLVGHFLQYITRVCSNDCHGWNQLFCWEESESWLF